MDIAREVENCQRYYKAKDKVINKILYNMIMDQMMHEPESIREYIPTSKRKELMPYIKKVSNHRYQYMMFTINPRPDTDLAVFLKQIKKATAKKWIKNYILCLEVRDQDFNGVHCHIRCEIDDKKNSYHCKREIYNTFKHLVDNKLHVNVRYGNREDCFIDYVKGLKKGQPKKTHDFDKEFRKTFGLKDYYSNLPDDFQQIDF